MLTRFSSISAGAAVESSAPSTDGFPHESAQHFQYQQAMLPAETVRGKHKNKHDYRAVLLASYLAEKAVSICEPYSLHFFLLY